MKKVIMMMAVAMMTACSNKVDNALNNESAAAPVDETKPLRLAVAGVTHGHVGEVAGRVGGGDSGSCQKECINRFGSQTIKRKRVLYH